MNESVAVTTKVLVVSIIVTAIIVGGVIYALTSITAPATPGLPTLPEKIKLGHILPLSGALSPYSEGFKNGVRLAAWEVNQKGGIGGREVVVIEEDDGTDASKAAEATKKLVDVDGVKVIIGSYASSCTMAAAPIVEENHVVLISPASTSPPVTQAGEYIYRDVPSDAFQGRALAEIALSKGYKTAATIAINNPYGIGIEEIFKKIFSDGGGKVLVSVRYELGAPTYKTELDRIKATNPDVIVDVSYADDGQIIFREGAELGIKAQWLAAEGIADPAIFKGPGVAEATEGMIATKPFTPTSPASAHFLELYKQQFGKEPGIYADYAYDAAKMALQAIALAGKYDGVAIKNMMDYVGNSYKGVTGDKTFDLNGDVSGEYSVLVVKNGEFVPIGHWSPSTGLQFTKG